MNEPVTVESHALHDLEWTRIVAAVTTRCQGPRREESTLPLAATFEQTERTLSETKEALTLLRNGDPLPLDGIEDIRPSLDRLDRDGVLDAMELRDVLRTLGASRRLRNFLVKRKALAPFLHRACLVDPTLDHLEEEITFSISEDGTIKDDATPELKGLRLEVANLRQRIVRRLEQLIHKLGSVLQDGFYTLREGRYVLPVRTDTHEKVDGIVHGSSASGATLFVEPKELVERGNRLKLAHSELAREEQKVLAALSDLVRQQSASLRQAAVALDHADLKAASAQLAVDFKGEIPELTATPRMDLRNARHPLLVLDGVDVVPNDLQLGAPHALVLSGPNAGGKTVVLKTLGLAALMLRAGLPLAVDEGSTCGFFAPVLSALGDEQSLERSLSTFSAHVVNVASIVESAEARVLVLLDELAGGTEPRAGAALACAIVEELTARGAATVVTTHYQELKALAAEREEMTNVSVGFDLDRMEPTFVATFGVAGGSNALEVAQRYGLQDVVVNQARLRLGNEAQSIDALTAELRQATQDAEARAADLERQQQSAERLQSKLREKEQALSERERRRFSEEGARLARQIRSIEESLRRAKRQLRDAQNEEALVEARKVAKQASEVLAQTHDRAAEPPPLEPAGAGALDLAVGDQVWVRHLRSEAEVVEAPARDKVRVAAGMMRLWVDVEQVRRIQSAEVQTAKESRTQPEVIAAPPRSSQPAVHTAVPEKRQTVPRTPHNTLDVRGLSVDDAVSMAESFLDRMYGAAEPSAYIVHGVGSGALRDAIREHLANDRAYVADFSPANQEEGGAQVTVVTLR